MDPSLRSRDIHLNKPGSKKLGNFHTMDRRDVREIGNNLDINGSTPGTLIKGIKLPDGAVKRISNPLQPNYNLPGAKEQKANDMADPWGEEGCSMTRAAYLARRPQTGKPRLSMPIGGAQNKRTDENNMNSQNVKEAEDAYQVGTPSVNGKQTAAFGPKSSSRIASAQGPRPASSGNMSQKSGTSSMKVRRMSSAQKFDTFIKK